MLSALHLLAIVFYSTTFFTHGVEDQRCEYLSHMHELHTLFSLIDSFGTLMIPFIIVLIITLVIMIRMFKFTENEHPTSYVAELSSRVDEPHRSSTSTTSLIANWEQISSSLSSTSMDESFQSPRPTLTPHEIKMRRTTCLRTTRYLALIIACFLVLYAPIFVYKLSSYIALFKTMSKSTMKFENPINQSQIGTVILEHEEHFESRNNFER